jgi:cytoskeletal protein RodZ
MMWRKRPLLTRKPSVSTLLHHEGGVRAMKELGEWMRREREARGFTCSRLEKATKISQRYIEAMEEGRFELLPEEAYRRAFIRTYARGLGMDPDPIVARYCEIAERDNKEVQTQMAATVQPPAAPERLARTLLAVFNGTMEWLGM